LFAALVTALRPGSGLFRDAERLRELDLRADFFADDFFAEDFRAADFDALFFRAGPRVALRAGFFIPREADFREDDLRAGPLRPPDLRAGPLRPPDLRPVAPFLPVFEPPRLDFLATAIYRAPVLGFCGDTIATSAHKNQQRFAVKNGSP
jgi:hypothetical protein